VVHALGRRPDRAHRRADGSDTSFPIEPGSAPFGITVGPDDAIWFAAMSSDRIGRIATDGQVTWLDLPAQCAMPSMIATGPADTVWATLNQANALAEVDIANDRATIHPLPTQDAGPVGIAATADAVWFTEIMAGQIGRIDATGHIREFPLPDRDARPHAIAADPTDGCWVTEWATNGVSHISDAGDIQHVALPADSEPHGLTHGPDEALWVALESGSVARIDVNQALPPTDRGESLPARRQ
jgi:virginiamycin B lyase